MIDDGSSRRHRRPSPGPSARRLPGLQVLRNEIAGRTGVRAQPGTRPGRRSLPRLPRRRRLAGPRPPGSDGRRRSRRSTSTSCAPTTCRPTDGRRVVVRAPEARRERVLDPRYVDPADDDLDDGRLLLRLGRHLRPADRAPAAVSRTVCSPPRTVPGAGGCTCRRARTPSPVRPGILYRRGHHDLADPDPRPSTAGLPAGLRAGLRPGAAVIGRRSRWWPKATRMFLAVLAHHVGRLQQMTPRTGAISPPGPARVAGRDPAATCSTAAYASVQAGPSDRARPVRPGAGPRSARDGRAA